MNRLSEVFTLLIVHKAKRLLGRIPETKVIWKNKISTREP